MRSRVIKIISGGDFDAPEGNGNACKPDVSEGPNCGGGGRQPKGNSNAKTTQEAADYATKNLGVTADYGGLDAETANAINNTFEEAINEFPEVKNLIKGLDDKPLSGDYGTVAITETKNGLVGRLSISPKIDVDKVTKQVETKYSPEGCATKQYYIDHEMGHAITASIKFTPEDQKELRRIEQRIYGYDGNKSKAGKLKMTESLSSYAATNSKEFLAEAWAEYKNNPNPRPTAKAVGEIIDKYKTGK